MPQAIPVLISVAIEYGAYYAAALLIITSYAVNDHQRRKAARKARDAFNDSLKDRLVMTSTSDGPRSRIYGECRNVDGVIFKGTHGSNSEFYTLVVALAGHECESIEKVYFNDQQLDLVSDGAGGFWVNTPPYIRNSVVTVSEPMLVVGTAASVTLSHTPISGSVYVMGQAVSEGQTLYTPVVVGTSVTATVNAGDTVVCTYQYVGDVRRARIWKYLGTSTQDIGTDLLQSRFPGMINVVNPNTGVPYSDRFAGICAVVVELEFDPDAFPVGTPNVTALVRGAKVYDPRDGTTKWTQNPSLIARDWSLHPNGGGCLPEEVPDDMVIAAANACDV